MVGAAVSLLMIRIACSCIRCETTRMSLALALVNASQVRSSAVWLRQNSANSPCGPQIGTDQPWLPRPKSSASRIILRAAGLDQSRLFQSIGWKRRCAPTTTGSMLR